jgi:hypothetical protein
MSSFRLKAGTHVAYLPVIGRVAPDRILYGEEFRRYVPQVLVEIHEEPVPETEDASPEPEVSSELLPQTESAHNGRRGRKKKVVI